MARAERQANEPPSPAVRPFDLAGLRALVTGGNSGIGLGMARGLARAGAAVAVVGRDPVKNQRALDELGPLNDGCRAFAFDLSLVDALPRRYAEVSAAMGGIDVLVNNAGTTFRSRADTVPLEKLDAVIGLNLRTTFVLAQCFARERTEAGRRGGAIIFTASLMSEQVRKDNAPYAAAKGAIRQLVKALAVDWAPWGIRVNGIGPGYVRTDLTRPLHEDVAFSAWVAGRTPLGRWAEPSDFEGAAVFLASPAAAFVTGQVLYVDGGWLATF
jgi:gluconate 5-dehydrogenase